MRCGIIVLSFSSERGGVFTFAVLWKSRLPFREIKEIVAERRKAAPKKAEHKWNYLLLWHFLMIHYLGPVVLEETSHGGTFFNMHHLLIFGFCFSRAGKTRMLGLAIHDYIFWLIVLIWTFFGPYLGSGSWEIGLLTALFFMFLFGSISYMSTKLLLQGARMYLGFDA